MRQLYTHRASKPKATGFLSATCLLAPTFLFLYMTATISQAGSTISDITWQTDTYTSTAKGSDLWPVTTASDGTVYTAWGDGDKPGCSSKVSYGIARIVGGPSTNLKKIYCGPGPSGKGKISSLIAIGKSCLYAFFNTQNARWPNHDSAVLYSTNAGVSWSRTSWVWTKAEIRPGSFVNYSAGNAGAPGGYVYAAAYKVGDSSNIYMMRVPQGSITTKSSYEYFSGTSASPAWSTKASRAKAIFTDDSTTGDGNFSTIVYNSGIGSYIMTHSKDRVCGKQRMYEATTPWGPWEKFYSTENWLGNGSSGDDLGIEFPVAWMTDGGKTMWSVFSCNRGKATYHDRYNLIKTTLQPSGSGGTSSGGSTAPTPGTTRRMDPAVRSPKTTLFPAASVPHATSLVRLKSCSLQLPATVRR